MGYIYKIQDRNKKEIRYVENMINILDRFLNWIRNDLSDNKIDNEWGYI